MKLKKDLNEKLSMTQGDIDETVGVSVPLIKKRAMKRLLLEGRIVRKGGKRFGYWGIIINTID